MVISQCGRLAAMRKGKLMWMSNILCLMAALGLAPTTFAQGNNGVDPTLASLTAEWKAPFAPHHVVGNVYYVGSAGLAAYLITTPAGHILINSNLESSV